jgi:outer membrane usher protein
LSAGLTAGYELSTGERAETSNIADGFKAAIRLSYRLDENSSLDAGHDTRNGQSRVSYRHQEGSGIGAWNTQVEVDRTRADDGGGGDDHYSVNGSLGYTANRAELSVSQHTGFAGLDTETVDQRTSVTAGTAIAFADGRVAVGRPVSGGFAIVDLHDNLKESQVTVGQADSPRASSDIFGPALLPDISPYSPSRVPVDVSNLPMGYDLGAGAFDLFPHYKSGYLLTVGSDYTVTAFGSLVDAEGEPVALLTGEAYEEGQQKGRKVTVFTNRVGKFGAQGLRPGRWVLDMATEPKKTRYVIDIPKDTVGLVRLDTLKPAGSVE